MSSTVLPWWSPRLWGAHALLLVVLAATIMLGYWQWHVSENHKAAQVAGEAHEQPRALAELMGNNDDFPDSAAGRPTLVQGDWVPGGTIYVQQNGGYWVVSPVAVGGAGKPAIYVIRGFSTTPHAPAVTGPTSLVAWLEPDGAGGTPDADPNDDVLPSLQLALAVPHVKQDLWSAWAVSADAEATWTVPTSNDGTADLTPVPDPGGAKADATTGLRNLLYAFEWWLFGCFAIYVWWRFVRDTTRPRVSAGADSGDPQDHVVPSQP